MRLPWRAARYLVAAGVLLLSACERAPLPSSDPEVIARYEGGTLSKTELQDALSRLPPERRPNVLDGSVTSEWLLEFAREMLVERLLGEDAAADPVFDSELDERERNLAWNELVARRLPPLVPPTGSEVEAAFERWKREVAQPETRSIRNIFVRSLPGESRSDTRRRAEGLATRVRAGEGFASVARAHSDSESRHRGGDIGILAAKDLPASVRETVFALKEHSVSEPLVNNDGGHLFYVERIIPATGGEFSDVEPLVASWLQAEAEERAIAELVRGLPEPSETLSIASPQELLAIMRDNDSQATVLKRGDYDLSLSDLMVGQTDVNHDALAYRLKSLAWREKAHAFAVSEGWLDLPHVRRGLDQAVDLHVGEQLRLEHMRQWVLKDPGAIESYFANQRARFSSPLSLHLERWRLLSRGASQKATMLALETHYRESDPSAIELGVVARLFGGSVEDLGWTDVDDLSSQVTTPLVVSLKPGETTPPYRNADGFEMLRVIERRDPSPRPLEAVHEQVVEAYLGEHGQRLYEEWREEFLSAASVEILSETIELPN